MNLEEKILEELSEWERTIHEDIEENGQDQEEEDLLSWEAHEQAVRNLQSEVRLLFETLRYTKDYMDNELWDGESYHLSNRIGDLLAEER